jgi:N-acetylglucosaminyldiphosphoundecaprenol N-acetyl-beta-D-mannosaminyltransferase
LAAKQVSFFSISIHALSLDEAVDLLIALARDNRIIRESRPDILCVALSFPKQELWISHYARECGVLLSIGVGAAFDFIAGIRRRAPLWMQQARLEWLHRLLQEPRRLWHRYLVLGPQFVCLTLAELMRTRKKALLKTGEIPTSERDQDR